MNALPKFSFDTIFESDKDLLKVKGPTFTLEELAEAKSESHTLGHREGFDKGVEETLGGIEKQCAEHLEFLKGELARLNERQGILEETAHQKVAEIVSAVTQKILPVFVQKGALDEILKVVDEAFASAEGKKLTIFVQPVLVDRLKSHVKDLSGAEGLEVSVKEDETLDISGCRVEWDGGGLERRVERITEEVNRALDRLKPHEEPGAIDENLDKNEQGEEEHE